MKAALTHSSLVLIQVSFVPHEVNQHAIMVLFNNEAVPGSPFVCNMYDTNSLHVNWEAIHMIPVRKTAIFTVDPKGVPDQPLSVEIKGG